MNVLLDRLARDRFLPLATLDHPDDATRVADEVVAAGIGTLEIALRTDAGLPGIAAVAARTDLLVGAGTVTSVALVDAVVAAGARFVVTPGFDRSVVERCRELDVPVLPGVGTAGEVMAALALGLDTVKLFPAGVLGGPALVDALAGPFPQVRLVPSGGVSRELAPSYLERPTVLAVSGSWSVGRVTV